MYEGPGDKIKNATVSICVTLVLAVILAVIFVDNYDMQFKIICGVVSVIVIALLGATFYLYGEIIDTQYKLLREIESFKKAVHYDFKEIK